MPNNISKLLAFGEHAVVCITNISIHSFGELVDRLQLSLFPFSLTKLSLIIYIRKYLNSLPFWNSALKSLFKNNASTWPLASPGGWQIKNDLRVPTDLLT
jgi:hypothetical protein